MQVTFKGPPQADRFGYKAELTLQYVSILSWSAAQPWALRRILAMGFRRVP